MKLLGRPLRKITNDALTDEVSVRLIVYYVVFMIIGDLSAYVLGLVVEREWGSQASLVAFLTLYFLFLWISWVLAVWITEPRRATA